MTIYTMQSLHGQEHRPRHGQEATAADDAHLASSALPSLRVGEWIVRPSLNQMERRSANGNGAEPDVRKLEPRLIDLLVFLADRPSQVVSKEELHEGVWHARAVADSALTRSIAELRRALGDDAQEPSYIQTIPKRGYRLVAPVAPCCEETPAPEPFHSPSKGRRPRLVWAAAVASLVTAAALGLLFYFLQFGRAWTDGGGAKAAPSRRPIESIAVLPLHDLSATSEDSYFADALTDVLTTDLARLSRLRVTSPRATEPYRDSSVPLQTIADELGVDVLLEGTVIRAPERIRVNLRLVAAATGSQLWAASYEKALGEALALQSLVAQDVATHLGALDGGESNIAIKDVDSELQDLYLRGRAEIARSWRHPEEAKRFFEQFLARAPDFAPAHAGLAEYYEMMASHGMLSPHEGYPLARQEANKAIEVDDRIADAHAVLAEVEFMFDWDWEAAEAEFLRALELNPSSAAVNRRYATFLVCMGRFDEAIAAANLAVKLEPNRELYQLPWILFNSRRYNASLDEIDRLMSRTPPLAGFLRAWNYALLGRFDEAIPLFEAQRKEKRTPMDVTLGLLGWTYGRAGHPEQAREILAELEGKLQPDGDVYSLALVYTGLGDSEEALTLLERAVIQRSPNAIYLQIEPFLDPLRDQPRFRRLLERTRLLPETPGVASSS